MSEKLVRHPMAVVAAWIVVALLAAPLFASLNKVVKTQQYSLPPSAEASKADELIQKVKGGGSSFGLVLVQGISLKDNDTLLSLARWGAEFNQTVVKNGIAKDVVGIPVILASINKTLYKAILSNITAASGQMKNLYEMLDRLDKGYAEALDNTTKMLKRLNQTAAAVAEADRGYSEAYRGLLQAANASKTIAAALVRLDRVYVNATDQLLGLAEKLNQTAHLLAMLDKAYSQAAANITAAYQRLLAAYSNQSMLQRLSQGLAFTWWQVARTYVIMDAVGGNYSLYARIANLTGVDPRLAPLPRQEALQAYMAVRKLLNETGDVDAAALKVAEEKLASSLPSEAAPVLQAVARAWLREAKTITAQYNSTTLAGLIRVNPGNPQATAKTQLLTLQLAQEAASKAAGDVAGNAAQLAARALAAILSKKMPANAAEEIAQSLAAGRLNTTLLAQLVAEKAAKQHPEIGNMTQLLAKLLVEADPEAKGLLVEKPKAALEAAKKLLEELGAPKEAVEAAAGLLEDGHVDRAEAAKVALSLMREEVARKQPEAAGLLPLLARYDPDARGTLAADTETLVKAVADMLAAEAEKKGMKLQRTVLEELVRMVVAEKADPKEAARKLAFRLVLEEAKKRGSDEKAVEMLSYILEKYDPEAKGLLAVNRTLALKAVLEMAKKQGMIPEGVEIAPGLVEKLLSDEAALRHYVAEEMLKHVLAKAPAEARPVIERFVKLLEEKGPGISSGEKWRLVVEITTQALEEKAGLPKQEAESFAASAARVARGEEKPETVARRIAERILAEKAAPRLLNETRGLMVSRSMDGFVVMFTPLGSSRDERANNTEQAARVAEKLLPRYGLSGADVLASGTDLLMKEVHEYAIKDAEKTSKISEAATFVVLLLILESVFAVLMPYIGIVLGLLAGGALVYLAAKAGVISLDSTAHSLMITTALGLGADYAAYLVHRFREEVAKGREQREAAAHALATAGPAIVASAMTVIIGFGSLLLGWDIAFLRGLGETIPVTVAATAAASLTLVPALLALIGGKKWFWWPRRPSRERHAERESRLMRSLHRHHRVVLAALLAAMLVGAYFYANFKGSHDMKLLLPENAEALKAFNVLKKDYMPGLTDPIYVVAVLPESYWDSAAARSTVSQLAASIEKIPGVGKVLAPTNKTGVPGLDMNKGLVSRDGKIVLIQAILGVDPYSDKGTEVVNEIHDTVHRRAKELGLEVYVGGAPYATIEMDRLLHERYYYRILPAASTLMVLVFTVIFGSLPASIAALMVIIGSAMMGIAASVVLFQDLLGKGVPWFLHIVSMMAVMGVGMDYNSFFLARALEECQRLQCSDTEEALAKATGAVGLFIVGLAFVVSSAYLSMLSASNIGMQAMGFTLGLTILLAGVMAGYLFTPLVIAMLGEKAWWPWGMKRRVRH